MRVNAYIDGFNLYYSIKSLKDDSLKWLDLRKMCSLFLKNQDILNEIYYFTAYTHFDYNKKIRHQIYVEALKTSDVQTIFGKFKKKYPKCTKCSQIYPTYEEKESDVNIAIQMLEDAFLDRMDKAFLITADTDLNSTIVKFKKLFPKKKIILLCPPNRRKFSNELRNNSHTWFEIKRGHIKKSLFAQEINDKIKNPFLI